MVRWQTLVYRWHADIVPGAPVDPEVVDRLAADLDRAGEPQQVALGFLRRPPAVSRFMDLLHRIVLDRIPADHDLAYWVQAYGGANDLLSCLETFLASEEFFQNLCGGNDDIFLTRLFAMCGLLSADGLHDGARAAIRDGARHLAVSLTVRSPQFADTVVWTLGACLGIPSVPAEEMRRAATNEAGAFSIEAAIAAILVHPDYVAAAGEGIVAKRRVAQRIGGLLAAIHTPELDPAAGAAAWATDVGSVLSGRTALRNLFLRVVAAPGTLERLVRSWVEDLAVPAALAPGAGLSALSDGGGPADAIDAGPPERGGAMRDLADRLVAVWTRRYDAAPDANPPGDLGSVRRWAIALANDEPLAGVFVDFLLSPRCLGWVFPEDLLSIAPNSGHFPVAPPRLPARTADAEPLVATSFFYWYDRETMPEFLVCPDSFGPHPTSDSLTLNPPDGDPFSYRMVGWFRRQLADMEEAGINVVLPVTYVHPWSDPQLQQGPGAFENKRTKFTDGGLRLLRHTWNRMHSEGLSPPKIGMLLDTSTFNRANVFLQRIDFNAKFSLRWVYESIRNFFSLIEPEMWATQDGRPIVFVYQPCFGLNLREQLYPYLRAAFKADFGADLYIVTAAEEEAPRVINPDRVAPWAHRMEREPSLDVLAALLLDEDLYASQGYDWDRWLDTVPRRVIGRAPTDGERAVAKARLQAGQRADVIRSLLDSDDFLRKLLADWFPRLLRVDFDPTVPRHVELAAEMVDRVRAERDIVQALAVLIDTEEFERAGGGAGVRFADWLYQSVVGKAPNADCPDGSTTSTDTAGRDALLADIQARGRRVAVTDFLRRFEVREAIVSGWLFFYYGHYNPGTADATFYWSAAISPTIRGVASIGPGYDQSKLHLRRPIHMPRKDGATYRERWEWILAMEPRPAMVHLETWNEFFEGTCICDTREFGRQYIALTREYALRFRGGEPSRGGATVDGG